VEIRAGFLLLWFCLGVFCHPLTISRYFWAMGLHGFGIMRRASKMVFRLALARFSTV
jgi:hypothetical protein